MQEALQRPHVGGPISSSVGRVHNSRYTAVGREAGPVLHSEPAAQRPAPARVGVFWTSRAVSAAGRRRLADTLGRTPAASRRQLPGARPSVRSWLRYLPKEGYPVPPPDVVEVPKNPRTVPELDERLPETVKLPPPPRPSDVAEILALRDRALILTLYSTQLRVSELCNLNRDQLDYERGLAVVVGKGRKTRTVFPCPALHR